MTERRSTVSSGEAELAVYEYGLPPGPETASILLVHGYPDDHRVFDGVVERLAADHHVISYDTRNAGASRLTGPHTAGTSRAAYRLPLLVADLYAVLAATGAGTVHLVGHDWGSIQGWAALRDPRARTRISSFTSISGPDLAHFRSWLAARLRTPRLWPQAANQALRSWYVAAFQIPVLPDVLWRRVLTPQYEKAARRSIGDSGVRGLQLYRANMFTVRMFGAHPGGASRDGAGTPSAVVPDGTYTGPVHVIVPLKDPFLSPRLVEGLEVRFPGLRVTEVNAGHWWPERHSGAFAVLLKQWVAAHPGPRGTAAG